MPSYELSRVHQLLIQYLEKLISGEILRLCIQTPPRIGKSLLGTILAPAYLLGRDPAQKVIVATYGSELSEISGRRCRNLISEPSFQQLFPACKVSPDSAAAFRFSTTANGEYVALGKGGPLTGRGVSSGGMLVLDDLVKDWSEAQSDAENKSTIEWLQSVALTRLERNARVLAIGTLWSDRDPLSWLSQQKGFVTLRLPAICDSTEDLLRREIGEPLWASQFPIEALNEIRASVGERVFQTLYQASPSNANGTIIKRQWFNYYQTVPQYSEVVQSWDTAFSSKKSADFSVCTTWAKCHNGYYLLHVFRERLEFPALLRSVRNLAEQYRPSEILVENRASGQSLVQQLRESTTYPVIPVDISKDKEERAHSCTGVFEAGKVFFPQTASWLADYESELCAAPFGSFDDQLDSTTLFLNRARQGNEELGVVQYYRSNPTAQAVPTVPVVTLPKPTVQSADTGACPQCGEKTCITQIGGVGFRCGQCGATWGNNACATFVCRDGSLRRVAL